MQCTPATASLVSSVFFHPFIMALFSPYTINKNVSRHPNLADGMVNKLKFSLVKYKLKLSFKCVFSKLKSFKLNLKFMLYVCLKGKSSIRYTLYIVILHSTFVPFIKTQVTVGNYSYMY